MKEILLIHGKVALVDDEDCDFLNQWEWRLNNDGYVRRGERFMHRVIMNTPDGLETDHINGDKLDNRKSNLRVCTKTQNHQNTNRKLNKYGYKGVNFDKRANRWYAHIKVNKVNKHVGCFKTPEEAAHAYDEAAKKYHGDFANLNFEATNE